MKLKRKSHNKYLIAILFIIAITILLLSIISKNISPEINNIVNIKLGEIANNIIIETIKSNEIYNIKYQDIMDIKTKNDEIISINYKLDKVYSSLGNINVSIKENLNNIENSFISKQYVDEMFFLNNSDNGLILLIPSGYVFKNSLFANIGPKIPVKILFIGNVLVNYQTKVTSYGLNNALLEIYLNIKIKSNVVFPNNKKTIDTSVDFLIAATAIQGRVPFIYGNSFEKNSELLSIPIENNS